jgi:hypothetical protein
MNESPRPDQLDQEERTPVSTEAEQAPTPADPASDPGVSGTASRYPLWLIVGAVVLFALVALYLALGFFPGASTGP